MRNLVAYGIGALSVLAISAAVAMGANRDDNHADLTETSEIISKANDDDNVRTARADTSEIQAAEQRALDAEARALAAEERVRCEKERQEASNRGAVVGGVTGAVIGTQVAGDGAKSEGGVLGGIAGVLAGRQIAKKDHRC